MSLEFCLFLFALLLFSSLLPLCFHILSQPHGLHLQHTHTQPNTHTHIRLLCSERSKGGKPVSTSAEQRSESTAPWGHPLITLTHSLFFYLLVTFPSCYSPHHLSCSLVSSANLPSPQSSTSPHCFLLVTSFPSLLPRSLHPLYASRGRAVFRVWDERPTKLEHSFWSHLTCVGECPCWDMKCVTFTSKNDHLQLHFCSLEQRRGNIFITGFYRQITKWTSIICLPSGGSYSPTDEMSMNIPFI